MHAPKSLTLRNSRGYPCGRAIAVVRAGFAGQKRGVPTRDEIASSDR